MSTEDLELLLGYSLFVLVYKCYDILIYISSSFIMGERGLHSRTLQKILWSTEYQEYIVAI